MSVSLTDVSYSYPVPDLDGSPFDDGPTPDREVVDQLRDDEWPCPEVFRGHHAWQGGGGRH